MKKNILLEFCLFSSLILAVENNNIKLETTTISAEGFEQTLQNTPKTIYIVTKEEISKSNAQTIPEILKMIPGVKTGEGEDGS